MASRQSNDQSKNQSNNQSWSQRVDRGLSGLRGLAEKFLENSPALIDELKTVARHPRSLGTWIESRSPWLNRRFLGTASNWVEPFTIGMGFQVENLGENSVEVRLPGSWRNQGVGGSLHSAALTALGEFTARLYWEHHLDLRSAEIDVRRVQTRLLMRPVGDMKGVFRLPVSDREAILHRLRAEGRESVDTLAQIYDVDGRLVAEVEVSWELTRQLMLSGRH